MQIISPQSPKLVREKSTQHLYYVDGLRRRRIIFPEVAKAIREKFSGISINEIDTENLFKFDPGARVPRAWSEEHWIEPPPNKQMMREIITSQLCGYGVEFGAGSRPMPLPLECQVEYSEPFQGKAQYKRMNYTCNTVKPTFCNPIENQAEIPDETLDFLVAAHVIEHTPNPIGAIVDSFRSLRIGGQLILVVPDMRRTFDKHRKITSLEHLIMDYESPSEQRDLENYIDFFRFARLDKNPEIEAIKAHKSGTDVHFHVWTPGSFSRMMTHIQANYAPFRSIEIKPPVADSDCLEFYVVAKK